VGIALMITDAMKQLKARFPMTLAIHAPEGQRPSSSISSTWRNRRTSFDSQASTLDGNGQDDASL
jgi:hypothetical protein